MHSYYQSVAPTELTISELNEVRECSPETSRSKEAQIRAAKVRSFFRDYENWNKEVDDGSLLQEREHELGITPEEWSEYHRFEIQF